MTVRELNGWAPTTVTFDAAGEVVSVTVQEPRFTPHEVDVLLASRREDLKPRGEHGLPLSVATDPNNRGRFKVGLPTRDFAQEALDAEREKYRKTYGDDYARYSFLWRVELDE